MKALGTEPLITEVAKAEKATDGALNPQWVEWLMGYPIGWTELKPSEMPLSRKSRKPSDAQSCVAALPSGGRGE